MFIKSIVISFHNRLGKIKFSISELSNRFKLAQSFESKAQTISILISDSSE